jgi:hypothetical protein
MSAPTDFVQVPVGDDPHAAAAALDGHVGAEVRVTAEAGAEPSLLVAALGYDVPNPPPEPATYVGRLEDCRVEAGRVAVQLVDAVGPDDAAPFTATFLLTPGSTVHVVTAGQAP